MTLEKLADFEFVLGLKNNLTITDGGEYRSTQAMLYYIYLESPRPKKEWSLG